MLASLQYHLAFQAYPETISRENPVMNEPPSAILEMICSTYPSTFQQKGNLHSLEGCRNSTHP